MQMKAKRLKHTKKYVMLTEIYLKHLICLLLEVFIVKSNQIKEFKVKLI